MKASRTWRTLIGVALVPLPQRLKRLLMQGLFGARIHSSATIGLSIIDCDRLEMGPGSRIGHFTVMRNLQRASLEAGAFVGNFNWITASREFESSSPDDADRGCFMLGRESAVTSRHYVDCSGGVTIGNYTTVAGVRTTILSHQIDLKMGVQSTKATRVGDYCFVSSNVCLTPGASIPDRSAIGMGAVVVGRLDTSGALYGGVPAHVVRSIIDGGAYFRRTRGSVGPERNKRVDGQPEEPDA